MEVHISHNFFYPEFKSGIRFTQCKKIVRNTLLLDMVFFFQILT